MGARVIKNDVPGANARQRESLTMTGILAAVIAPLLLLYLLVQTDLRRNLSDLDARPGASLNEAPLVSWKSLAMNESPAAADILRTGPRDDSRITMLGYMMEGGQNIPELTRVSSFMLMPDAGSWAHAAHLEPDEMVKVSLFPNARVLFTNRRLVWVTGSFAHLQSRRHYGEALYGLNDALVVQTAEKDLSRWLIP